MAVTSRRYSCPIFVHGHGPNEHLHAHVIRGVCPEPRSTRQTNIHETNTIEALGFRSRANWSSQMKCFGPFRLDTMNHCLWREEERMSVTPKAFDVLRFLVERADRLVTQ